MGMGSDDEIGNGNGKKWETTCMGIGMAFIPMGINIHRSVWLMFWLEKERYCFLS